MDGRRGVLDSSAKNGNVVRKIGHIEKLQNLSSLFSEQNAVGSPTGTRIQSLRPHQTLKATEQAISTMQDDVSPISSTVSSFVSSSDGGHNREFKTKHTMDSLEPTSSAFFRKTYQCEYKVRQMQQRANHLVVNSKRTSPAFFWKTQRHNQVIPISVAEGGIHGVNTKLESSRLMHHVA